MTRLFDAIFAVGLVIVAALGSHRADGKDRAVDAPVGELRNPYGNSVTVAEEGKKLYRALDCTGCHGGGGGGGGGMAAPLTNEIWIYGSDDDTLFRVIALGTGSLSPNDAFRKQGFVRKGSENVVGPMPPYGDIVKTDNDIWKIIAWIRSINPPGR